MLPLLIPFAVGLLSFLAIAMYHSLTRRKVSRPWFVAFFAMLAIGTLVGIYFGFFFTYMASPNVRIYSFPIPTVFFVLETNQDGTRQWVDFITPAPILFAISNVVIFACLAVLPVWLANTLCRFINE